MACSRQLSTFNLTLNLSRRIQRACAGVIKNWFNRGNAAPQAVGIADDVRIQRNRPPMMAAISPKTASQDASAMS